MVNQSKKPGCYSNDKVQNYKKIPGVSPTVEFKNEFIQINGKVYGLYKFENIKPKDGVGFEKLKLFLDRLERNETLVKQQEIKAQLVKYRKQDLLIIDAEYCLDAAQRLRIIDMETKAVDNSEKARLEGYAHKPRQMQFTFQFNAKTQMSAEQNEALQKEIERKQQHKNIDTEVVRISDMVPLPYTVHDVTDMVADRIRRSSEHSKQQQNREHSKQHNQQGVRSRSV